MNPPSRLRFDPRQCERWLTNLDVSGLGSEAKPMQALGLLLITSGETVMAALDRNRRGKRTMPAMETLVMMRRRSILTLTRRMLAAESVTWVEGRADENATVLGALAIVFARSGDLNVVAAILRAAAAHRLSGPTLDAAFCFLESQQSASGGFGLLAAALSDPRLVTETHGVQLRVTVEVLWALIAYGPLMAAT